MQTCLLFNTDFIGFDLHPLVVVKILGLIISTRSVFCSRNKPGTNHTSSAPSQFLCSSKCEKYLCCTTSVPLIGGNPTPGSPFQHHLCVVQARPGPRSITETVYVVYTLLIPPSPAISLCSYLPGSTGEASGRSSPAVLPSKNIDHNSSFLLQLNFDKAVSKAQEELPVQPVFTAPLELSPPPCDT